MAKKLKAVLEVTLFIAVLMVFAHWSISKVATRFGGTIGNIYLGLLWAVPPLLYLLVAKKGLSFYGLDLRRAGRRSVHCGFWGLVLCLVQAPGFVAWAMLGASGIVILYGCVIASIVLLLRVLKAEPARPRIGWKIATLILLLVLPSVVATLRGKAVLQIIGWQVFYLLAVGLGEELRSRGYVQSRLNEAFGRPWTIWGTRFGPGLLIDSVIFGLPHVYQIGASGPNVLIGIGAALGGLFYGIVRERAESVWASALVHGVNTAAFEIYRHIFVMH